MKRRLLLFFTIILLPILTSCRSRNVGEVTFEPYSFETVAGEKIDAQLGRLTVPENRSDPKTQLIELAFVVLKSTAKKPEAPIVFLAGGPGVSGIEHAKGPRAPALLALREIADVVLLDQRGTGISKPDLSCDERLDYPLNQPASRESLLEAFKRQARKCAQDKRLTGDLFCVTDGRSTIKRTTNKQRIYV